MTEEAAPAAGPRGGFPATRWSVVAAARSADAVERSRALDVLAAVYWKPVYKHVRWKWGKGHEEASDLVQDFFAEVVERDLLARYDPSRARLRTYLRVCVDGLVVNAAKAGGRQKRGGGAVHLSLDFEAARAEAERAAPAGETPEEAFEREYRRSVLSLAIERLEAELLARGKERTFRLFAAYDLLAEGDPPPTYAALAQRHGVATTDVTNALSAARRDLRRIAHELVGEVSGSEGERRGEARSLLGSGARARRTAGRR